MAHAEAGGWISFEFEASLVYIVSSRPDRVAWGDPVSKQDRFLINDSIQYYLLCLFSVI